MQIISQKSKKNCSKSKIQLKILKKSSLYIFSDPERTWNKDEEKFLFEFEQRSQRGSA